MLQALTTALLSDGKGESFQGQRDNGSRLIVLLVSLLIVYALILLFGLFLWNNYLTKAFSFVQPLEGIVDLLAVSILLRLLFC